MRIQDIILVRIPNAKLRLLLRMAKTLVRDAPELQNQPTAAALAKLIEHILVIDEAFSRRLRLRNPQLLARELEFDRAVDSLWVFLRNYLTQCAACFGHAGLDHLSEARKTEVDLEDLRELADVAASLHDQLFAADGTAFTRAAFPDQAEAMATILRIIEQDELGDEIERVFSDRILELLIACQAEYEELVSARMRRELGVAEDFRELRHRLRWLLARYKGAVETLYDEDQPETEAVVESALRALLIVSAHMARGTNASQAELDSELVEAPDLDDLEADGFAADDSEPEAVDGFDPGDSVIGEASL